jgi:hypothetical protein
MPGLLWAAARSGAAAANDTAMTATKRRDFMSPSPSLTINDIKSSPRGY